MPEVECRELQSCGRLVFLYSLQGLGQIRLSLLRIVEQNMDSWEVPVPSSKE